MAYTDNHPTGAPLAAAAVFYSGRNAAAAKKLLIFATLSLWLGAACYGDTWRLVMSYPTPGPDPRGYSGGPWAGYLVMGGANPYVLHYWWEESSVLSSFPAPGGAGTWGLARGKAGGGLFITNNLTSWIYETTDQGSLVNSFLCPLAGPADCDFRPEGFVVAIPDQNVLAVLNSTTGSLIATYTGPGSRPTGCTGYAHFYVADAGTRTVYENGVPIITGIQTPVGFHGIALTAWPYDMHLCIVDDATDRYYFYTCPENRVFPASLGRVKALFK